MKNLYNILWVLFVACFICCTPQSTPKPREYFRITFPEKKYSIYNDNMPYSFEIPQYCHIEKEQNHENELYWNNIVFDDMNAKIHLSYKKVDHNIDTLIEDAHTLAYKHTIKADAIEKVAYENDSLKVYGLLYNIKGNVASPIQFFVTDSTKNFLRGSLYFNYAPNIDSLAPAIDFVAEDITHLIETIQWNN
ncbi:MAG: gliding motility lipoprotein GldD [Bacteroidales bacterium]|nr:gliding motility lipoprotein GldD [Bacteroidales bacterium]